MKENFNEVGELVRKSESIYRNGNTNISRYVTFDLLENLERIDAYANSKHVSGQSDSQGREKPFFNICTSAINVWYRATDIDRKDIRVRPTQLKDTLKAFIATQLLDKWMREANFGKTLNTWGKSLAKNGSSVLKFVEKDGELIIKVMPWQDIIIDSVSFEDNPVIEILQLTPAQLRMNTNYDKEQVEELIEAVETRETADGQKKDTKAEYIKLYEIHGNLPLSYLTGDEKDEYTYVQQMHVISSVESQNGDVNDFSLVSGKEKKSPYMITHLIEEENRSQSIGAVEHLFEAQWMQNHTAKAIKDHLDLASKLIFQTSDGNFVGQNALSAIENGDIMVHAPNEPLSQLNNSSHDIASLQSYGQQWKSIGNENTGVSEAMLGVTPKSGTAWRQTEAILQESHSLFEVMTENKGLHIEDMMREYVLPYIKKTLKNKDEIMAVLEDHDIKMIDSIYVPNKATEITNNAIVEMVLNDEQPTPEDQLMMQSIAERGVEKSLEENGNKRFFSPSEATDKNWSDILDGMVWDLEVDVTGEQSDTQSIMATLSTLYQIAAGSGDVETANLVKNKILLQTGLVSPLELSTSNKAQQPQQAPQPEAPAFQPTAIT
jgi:hypothetical protein